jgi:hypothetical protein
VVLLESQLVSIVAVPAERDAPRTNGCTLQPGIFRAEKQDGLE